MRFEIGAGGKCACDQWKPRNNIIGVHTTLCHYSLQFVPKN